MLRKFKFQVNAVILNLLINKKKKISLHKNINQHDSMSLALTLIKHTWAC